MEGREVGGLMIKLSSQYKSLLKYASFTALDQQRSSSQQGGTQGGGHLYIDVFTAITFNTYNFI